MYKTAKVPTKGKDREIIKGRKIIFIDQTPAMEFGKNRNGFLKNDREILMEASARGDKQSVREIMEQVSNDIVKAGAPTAGLTDSQILDTLLPNWASSPAELRELAREYASKYNNSSALSADTKVDDPPVDVDEKVEPKSE